VRLGKRRRYLCEKTQNEEKKAKDFYRFIIVPPLTISNAHDDRSLPKKCRNVINNF
jgi:hypothetical protein